METTPVSHPIPPIAIPVSPLLRPVQSPSSPTPQPALLPRFGHSMVLDPHTHTLFIFAGQRDDKYLSDMYAYDIVSNTVSELFSNFSASGGPDACFTQRAVVDPGLKEVYVCVCLLFFACGCGALTRTCKRRFCGLTRAQQTSALTVLRSDAPNWVYQYTNPAQPGKWTQILPEVFSGDGEGENKNGVQHEAPVPLPRYAHQVVYDERTKKVYMHGGNAGEGWGGGGEEKENEEARVGGAQASQGANASAREGENSGGGGDGSGSWRGGEGGEEERPRLKETRLDDFWVMNLVR